MWSDLPKGRFFCGFLKGGEHMEGRMNRFSVAVSDNVRRTEQNVDMGTVNTALVQAFSQLEMAARALNPEHALTSPGFSLAAMKRILDDPMSPHATDDGFYTNDNLELLAERHHVKQRDVELLLHGVREIWHVVNSPLFNYDFRMWDAR